MRHVVAALAQCLGLCVLGFSGLAQAATEPDPLPPGESEVSGWTLTMDNDALVPGGKDADYTGGLAVTVTGAAAAHTWLSLHRWVDKGIGALSDDEAPILAHSLRGGLIAFTPDDIKTPSIIPDDRPYSSLVFLTSSSLQQSSDGMRATHGGISIGILGLRLMGAIQESYHESLGDNVPQGWDHQISDGGEPTININFGQQRYRGLVNLPLNTRVEFKDGWDLSLGTETAAAYGVSLRFGRYNTPWWSYSPEQIGYITPAAPVHGSGRPRKEFYLTTGARLKLRLYNAFLQGQFRHSDHNYAFEQLQPAIAEGWFGANWQFLPAWRTGWVVRAQTTEIRSGTGDRGLVYGGLYLTREL